MSAFRINLEGQDETLAWAGKQLDVKAWPYGSHAMSIEDATGKRVAAVIFTENYESHCSISVASDGTKSWANRAMLREIFGYAYFTLRNKRLSAYIAESNHEARAFNVRLGFTPEGVLRQALDGHENVIVSGMLWHECPWIKGEF